MSLSFYVQLQLAQTRSTVPLARLTAQANATRIEDLVQGRMQHLPFGAPRLWRCRAKGAKYKGKGVKTHKVFVTFSWKARKLIRKGKLLVNH